MQNYEQVLDCFNYLISDTNIKSKYIIDLYMDVKYPLLDEGILCGLKFDEDTDNIIMFFRTLEDEESETIILIRDKNT